MTHNLGQIMNWQCLIKLSFFTDGHAGWSPPEGNGDLVGSACFEWVQASSFWELLCTYCMCLPKGPFGWHDAVRALSRSVPLRLRYSDRRDRVRPSLALPALPAVKETPSGQGAAPVSFSAEDPSSTAGGGRPALPHREDGAMAAQSSAGLHRGSVGESVKDGALKQVWHLLDGFVDPQIIVKHTELNCLLFQGRVGHRVSSHLTQEINGSIFHTKHQSLPLQGQY